MSIGRVPGVTGIQPSIVDAKGDLIVATAADSVDRLAVGANNTVLTADSATATGLKWAAVASGSFTKIASGTFSAASTVDVDNIFSSTYDVYFVNINAYGSVANGDFFFQLRFAGPSTRATDYYTSAVKWNRSGTETSFGASNTTSAMIDDNYTNNAAFPSAYNLYFNNLNATGAYTTYWGTGLLDGTQSVIYGGQNLNSTGTAYTGLRFLPSSGTLTGKYYVYGLEK